MNDFLLGCLVSFLAGWFLRPSGPLNHAYKEIEQYRLTNRTHRSGVKMLDMTTPYLVSKAREELDEFEDSYKDGEAELNELCDVLNILFHVAIKHGWSPKDLGDMMVTKMEMRFLQ